MIAIYAIARYVIYSPRYDILDVVIIHQNTSIADHGNIEKDVESAIKSH